MIFHIAAHAALYLNDDRSVVMHQRRSGTDVCEHLFSKMRSINTKPNMQQARETCSKVTSTGSTATASMFGKKRKGNSDTADTEDTYAEWNRPMPKKRRPN